MKELDQFTVERLTQLSVSENLPEVAALARIALAAKRAIPSYWITYYPNPDPSEFDDREHSHSGAKSCAVRIAGEIGGFVVPVYHGAPQLNSPEIPDGWVMVPKEPTESMIIDGFESEPDKYFSDKDEWKAYKEMSGCQQAAHRAKLCWNAMLAAAPKPEK